ADVIPGNAQRVDVTLAGVRDREPVRGGVAGVIEMQRFGRLWTDAHDPCPFYFNRVRRADRPLVTLMVEVDRRRLHPEDSPDETRESGHWSAGRAAGNRANGVTLFGIGSLVDDDPVLPVPFAHGLRCEGHDDEAEIVEWYVTEVSLFDLEGHREGAGPFCRGDAHTARNTEADEIAAAGLVVLAADAPGWRRHRELQSRSP